MMHTKNELYNQMHRRIILVNIGCNRKMTNRLLDQSNK